MKSFKTLLRELSASTYNNYKDAAMHDVDKTYNTDKSNKGAIPRMVKRFRGVTLANKRLKGRDDDIYYKPWSKRRREPVMEVRQRGYARQADQAAKRAERHKNDFPGDQEMADMFDGDARDWREIAKNLRGGRIRAAARKHRNMDTAARDDTDDKTYKYLTGRKGGFWNTKESVELDEAIFGQERYKWRIYTGARPITLPYRSKVPHVLHPGDKFGIRVATSAGGRSRIVMDKYGLTKVFSFDHDDAMPIWNNSRPADEKTWRENVELDEEGLSKKRLVSYTKKAVEDNKWNTIDRRDIVQRRSSFSQDPEYKRLARKGRNRISGIDNALDRLGGNMKYGKTEREEKISYGRGRPPKGAPRAKIVIDWKTKPYEAK